MPHMMQRGATAAQSPAGYRTHDNQETVFRAWLAEFVSLEEAARAAFAEIQQLRAEAAFIPVSQPPDDDTLVLMSMSDGEVYPGYLDGGVWRYADGMPASILEVLAWRHMPAGHPATEG